MGINLNKATLSSGAGNITLHGQGYTGGVNTSSAFGILLQGNAIVQSTTGTATLTGAGGGSGSGTGNKNYGISVGNGAISGGTIQSTGNGVIIVNGTGGTGSGGINYGIYGNFGAITGNGGSMSITGTGGNDSGDSNAGISLLSTTISNSGAGTLTVTGTGGGNTNSSNNAGIATFNGGFSTVDGALIANGTGGGAGTGVGNYGVVVTFSGFNTTGTGNLTINGIRGGGDTATNYGLYLQTPNNLRTTGSGNIAVNVDTLFFSGSNEINSIGNVTIAPYNTGTTIGVAGGAGTLNLSSTYLGYITTGAGKTLTIGSASDGGLMRVAGADLSGNAYNLSLVSGSGDIQFDGGATALTLAANKNFSETTSGGSFTTATADGTITTSGSGNITLGSAVSLGKNLTLTTASADTLTFGSTINGGHNLTANAGTFSFAAALGGSAALNAVSLTSAGSLSLPSITASSIFARTTGAAADMTIPVGKTLTASGGGDAIVLVSGRNFINNAGAGALSAPGSGRWLSYSNDPAADTTGGLSPNFIVYSCTYGGACGSIPAGNGFLYAIAGTSVILNIPTVSILTAQQNAWFNKTSQWIADLSNIITADPLNTATLRRDTTPPGFMDFAEDMAPAGNASPHSYYIYNPYGNGSDLMHPYGCGNDGCRGE